MTQRNQIGPGDAEDARYQQALVLRRVALVSAALFFAATLIATLYVVYLVRATQVTNTGVLQSAEAAADAAEEGTAQIKSCTTPGEECWAEGQKQTAKAVGDLSRVSILASACAAGLPNGLTDAQRVTLTTTCVTERLTRHASQR